MCLTAVAAHLVACGGDGAERPPPIEGPFAQISGAQHKVIRLAPGHATVQCLPKPGLEEFEYEAIAPEGDTLRLVIKEYRQAGTFTMRYGVTAPQHRVDVDLAGGHKYRFFQHLRTDTNEVYPSVCNLTIAAEELSAGSFHYAGHLNCTLLWADSSSPDYAGASKMNAFIDLNSRFECKR